MTRKSFPVLLFFAVLSVALVGFSHSVSLADAKAPEPALEVPILPSFLEAEALVCVDSIQGDTTTSLTVECGECLAECMQTTGQSSSWCRMNDCMWECND